VDVVCCAELRGAVVLVLVVGTHDVDVPLRVAADEAWVAAEGDQVRAQIGRAVVPLDGVGVSSRSTKGLFISWGVKLNRARPEGKNTSSYSPCGGT